MNKTCSACTLIFASILSCNAHASALFATMTFESKTLTSEGVTKQTYFQEKLIRDDNTIWTERIIPATAPHIHHNKNEHDDEHNLNFATAGKWISRDTTQKITFRFVRADEKKIIAPRDSDYGTLGFDGDWETAYYLVNRTALKKMARIDKPAPKGATWFERKNTEEFTRILWDENLQIPLSIESGRFDGTIDNKITLSITSSTPTAAPNTLPWNKLQGYQVTAYEDLLD